ncbi:MAG: NifB/NifX family molybdenum-iron cluster-binding protein [Oscillospiraceae bacterium]
MKIAVTYENGQVFQHFGHCEHFKIYEVQNGGLMGATVVSAEGSGHGALAGFLKSHQVDTLICGGIGGGARVALEEAGIELFPGVTGDADKSVAALLSCNLSYDPNTTCSHHHEGEAHDCGGHPCGEDKHGCSGSHE